MSNPKLSPLRAIPAEKEALPIKPIRYKVKMTREIQGIRRRRGRGQVASLVGGVK